MMKRNNALALITMLLTLVALVACSAGSPPKHQSNEPTTAGSSQEGLDADEQAPPAGQIYLYGEYHGDERFLNQELELWGEHYYNDGMRHLFVELSYDDGEFLNLWMQADSDDLLDMVYDDWPEGAGSRTPEVYEFYKTIKRDYPETIFHGTDVSFTYDTTALRFLEYLESNGQKDSRQYELTQEAIEQGQFYSSNGGERTESSISTAKISWRRTSSGNLRAWVARA